VGADFPAGRPAKVTLRGVLYSPGRQARKWEWNIERRAESSTRIPLRVTSAELGRALAGNAHATFRGELSVGFVALGASGPTLTGRLEPIRVDFFGPPGPDLDVRDAEAFRAYLGLTLDRELNSIGVEVGSPAEQAGLGLGDRLLELDGVRLQDLRDLRPSPLGTVSDLVVARRGHLEPLHLTLDRAGFEGGLFERSLPAALCWVAGLLALLFAARPPGIFRWASFQRAVRERRPARARSLLGLGTMSGVGLGLALRSLGLREIGVRHWPSAALLIWVAGFVVFVWTQARPDVAERAPTFGVRVRQGLWALLSSTPLVLGGLVSGFEGSTTRGSRFATDAAWPLIHSPWLLLLGLGFLAALLEAARVGRFETPKVRQIRDLSLALLAVFWVNSFLTPPSEWVEPARAVFVAWGAVCLLGGVHAAARALGTRAVGRLSLSPGLGLSAVGFALYGLTLRFAELRVLPGLGAATLTLLGVGVLVSFWAGLFVFARQARTTDPWI